MSIPFNFILKVAPVAFLPLTRRRFMPSPLSFGKRLLREVMRDRAERNDQIASLKRNTDTKLIEDAVTIKKLKVPGSVAESSGLAQHLGGKENVLLTSAANPLDTRKTFPAISQKGKVNMGILPEDRSAGPAFSARKSTFVDIRTTAEASITRHASAAALKDGKEVTWGGQAAVLNLRPAKTYPKQQTSEEASSDSDWKPTTKKQCVRKPTTRPLKRGRHASPSPTPDPCAYQEESEISDYLDLTLKKHNCFCLFALPLSIRNKIFSNVCGDDLESMLSNTAGALPSCSQLRKEMRSSLCGGRRSAYRDIIWGLKGNESYIRQWCSLQEGKKSVPTPKSIEMPEVMRRSITLKREFYEELNSLRGVWYFVRDEPKKEKEAPNRLTPPTEAIDLKMRTTTLPF
ncbi:hypothetical protein GQ43DRAFT_431272 [Delitschia confertaspora ATCC 74209]|uniref:Uncharacterized protein n=1 Tax=Delitschia confertaspora ATCC 74209 TaxID=1513339 RepID=A0A9P4MSV4_9PLEO|nr:hypothetical protein GQ43DRAFT_431272 [Delitschia confertaspora ATCC 74209]